MSGDYMTTQRGEGIRKINLTDSTTGSDRPLVIVNGFSKGALSIERCKIIDDEDQSGAGIYLSAGTTDLVRDLGESD